MDVAKQIVVNNPATVEELLAQESIVEAGKTVSEVLTNKIATIGENMSIRRFERFETNGVIGSYIHGDGKIAVLVNMTNANKELAKDVCMQIAAARPEYLNREAVPQEQVAKEKAIFVYKTLKIDFDARRVFINDLEIELTHKEYELLVTLVQNVNNAVTREELVTNIWDSTISSDDRTLDTHIKSLRKKILEYADNIITIRRVGYRFEIK